jgi:hypothetical protein
MKLRKHRKDLEKLLADRYQRKNTAPNMVTGLCLLR